MEIARVSVSGVEATTVDATLIPAGIIGATVTVEYGPEWGGMVKNVSFRGAEDVSVLNVGDSIKLPPEVVAKPNVNIQIGFTGVSGDGSVLIPTLWADLGTTRPASSVNVDRDSTPPIWAQVVAMIGNLENLSTEAKENLVDAINEVFAKAPAGGGFVAQDTAPTDTSVLWIDTDDNSGSSHPDYGTEDAGKLLYIAADGTVRPLAVGAGLKIVNGVLMLVSGGGEIVTIEAQVVDGQYVLSDSNGNTITPDVSADGLLTWPGVSVCLDDDGMVNFRKE